MPLLILHFCYKRRAILPNVGASEALIGVHKPNCFTEILRKIVRMCEGCTRLHFSAWKRGYVLPLKHVIETWDVGMAVPKITETMCRNGSVQAKLITIATQVTPFLHLF